MPFAHVIPVPLGNRHHHVTLHHRLTPKPRMELVIRRLLHAVEFVVFHLGKIQAALFDNHVAGGAGAASTAGMLEVKTEIHGNVQQ
jgi:hypothetical protein